MNCGLYVMKLPVVAIEQNTLVEEPRRTEAERQLQATGRNGLTFLHISESLQWAVKRDVR